MARSHGIDLKKKHGQHFLRDVELLVKIPDYVTLGPNQSVFEIGCGDGALTHQLLQRDIARLWVFEIDPEWAELVSKRYADPRLTVIQKNVLDADLALLEENAPWVLVANLPYQIVFPLLYRLQKHRHVLSEGVIMVQEEVAQKIVAKKGRKYGVASLFFQRYFEWQLLDKVSPNAFYPPPKVFSRLLHFKPILDPAPIVQEEKFWIFVRSLFAKPRRTIRNNLKSVHYPVELISDQLLSLRAQQLSMQDIVGMWDTIIKAN